MPAGMESQLNPGVIKVVIHQPIEGKDPDLCNEARNIIADVLIREGYELNAMGIFIWCPSYEIFLEEQRNTSSKVWTYAVVLSFAFKVSLDLT